jgi:LuxR family maltose regulon positive regulatory protein
MAANPLPASDPESFTRFGELLRFLRLRARLTQRELSIAVGYNFAQISRLEQGQRLPDPVVVAATFVPALDIALGSPWATRLVALAESARRDPQAAPSAPEPRASSPAVPQSAPLLATKLFVPRVRADVVARPRLLALLARAAEAPLTLIAAPAGFGKTTLLGAWLQSVERRARSAERPDSGDDRAVLRSPFYALRFAWLALDDGDNDPTTFLRYLIAALQTVAPAVGGTAFGLLQAPQPPPLDTLVRLLLNDLAALRQDMLLVLDDYHLITTPAIHAALTVLLDYMPPTLHLVVATRADPPLPLARLRARGQLVELRAADIRFTSDESAAFLVEAMALPLSPDDVAVLETRTEGWIAGLQLAALAMRQRSDLPAFISAFTGSNRFVIDYLAAEVFARQPPHIQTFLLQTAILDRLCGPLCDAVLGLSDLQSPISNQAYSQLILEELERANLFLVPLDDERRWFRYHHLFGAFLRERLLHGAGPDDVATLHRRAGDWHEGQGLIAETIHHALASRDWEWASHVIEDYALPLMMGGQVQTGLSWLEGIPAAVMQRHPLACILHAIGLMLVNDLAASEARLQDAERGLAPDASEELARVVRGSVMGVRGRFLYFAGDLARALEAIRQALELLPPSTTSIATGGMSAMARAAWSVYIATAYQLTGDVTTVSEQRVAAGIAPVRALGHTMATLTAYTSLGDLQVLQGRLRAAAATYAEVDRLVPGQDALNSLVGSPSYYVGMGDLLRERNALDDAERYLARGMRLVQGALATEGEVIVRCYLTLARVQQARGDGAAALATVDAFTRLARDRGLFHMLTERALAMRARLRLMQGDVTAALRWADGAALPADDDMAFPHQPIRLTLARARIAAGRPGEATPLLERLLADAELKGRMHSAIEILALQALGCHALGDEERAFAALERALALGEPEGYLRTFVDEGEPMRALLADFRSSIAGPRHPLRPFVERLLATYSPDEPAPATAPERRAALEHQVEPLTDRELEVLRMVAVGQTNRAIASALVIEYGTVKRHLHSAFGKLGANNRTEAVAHARAKGLL